jgi:hypothetical protein
VTASLESARRDWEDGFRNFELACRDRTQSVRLHEQLDAVSAELRRRVGSTFTLRELAAAYDGADDWVRHAIEEAAPVPGWARSVAMVGDACFHVYARGAVDYAP